MIIVEGPDGSGKSTLIKNLGITETLWMGGVRVRAPEGVRWVNPEAQPVEQFFGQIDKHTEHPVAFDRFHISEKIYGPILRGQQALPDHYFNDVCLYLRTLHIPVILCLPSFEVTLANVKLAGRERPLYQTEAFLERSYKRFRELMPWATVAYDFTRDPLPEIPKA